MTTNVRFYRLDELPSFIVDKHKGIFVHVTKTMYKDGGSIEHPNPKDPTNLLMKPRKDGESVERINFVHWLTERNIEEIASGLWFGGENGWELLSNETTDAAIDAAITTKIQGLDAGPYAQATITTATNSSTLTIKGIQEVDGKIGIPVDTENRDLNIAIDGVYDETDNKIATQKTVKNAIEALDVNTAVQAVTTAPAQDNTANTVLTFNGIKEVDGKIAQGDGTSKFTVGDAKLKIQIGSAEATNVFSANAIEDSTIQLDGLVFRKNDNNEISVITPTAVASNNRLVTEKDIANLSGAMHYRGSIASNTQWPENVKAGDVYIVTTSFTHSGESNPFEVGDMIVFNTDGDNSKYTVVQSNITLGTGIGQVAANTDVLASGNLVVATDNGIKTTSISASVLEDANNTRNLTYGNVAGGISITDSLKIMNRNFNESINITSTNRSIKIAANASENATNVVLDLVWNTIME